MKKQLIIIGVIVILLTVGLSGCNENTSKSDEDKLIGTWTNRIMYEDNSTVITSYIFYTNKTFNVIGSSGNKTLNVNGTWNITDDKLIMISKVRTLTVDYKFSELNNDKILTLTDESGHPEDFIKE